MVVGDEHEVRVVGVVLATERIVKTRHLRRQVLRGEGQAAVEATELADFWQAAAAASDARTAWIGTVSLLLRDPAFNAADTAEKARLLAAAVKKIGNVDLVIAAEESLDSHSGQTGPRVAQELGWLQTWQKNRLLNFAKHCIKTWNWTT